MITDYRTIDRWLCIRVPRLEVVELDCNDIIRLRVCTMCYDEGDIRTPPSTEQGSEDEKGDRR